MGVPRHMLCAIDFSPISIEALRYAILVAKRSGAQLHLAHVWQLPVVSSADGAVVVGLEMSDRIESDLTRQLADLAARHGGEHLAIETHLAMGEPAATTVTLATRLQCDVIVIGTHGRSGLPRVILGSVAERVVRMAHGRVIVVPPPAEDRPSFAERPVSRIVCPIDFSEGSELALRDAVELAETWGAKVTVVHGYSLSAYSSLGSALAHGVERELRVDLENAVRRYASRGVAMDIMLRHGVVYEEIVAAAVEVSADLVVIGTAGRTGIARFMLGSVAERVVRSSPIPVMVVRSGSVQRVEA